MDEETTVHPLRRSTLRLLLYLCAFGVMLFGVMLAVSVVALLASPTDLPNILWVIAFFLGMEALAIYQLRRLRREVAAVR